MYVNKNVYFYINIGYIKLYNDKISFERANSFYQIFICLKYILKKFKQIKIGNWYNKPFFQYV